MVLNLLYCIKILFSYSKIGDNLKTQNELELTLRGKVLCEKALLKGQYN